MLQLLALRFCHRKFFTLVVFVFMFGIPTIVQSARSSVSSSSAEAIGGSSTASRKTSSSSTSTGVSGSTHHRGRDLIASQIRAIQDASDLETSESTHSTDSGMSIGAASASAAGAGGFGEDQIAFSKYIAAGTGNYSPAKVRLNGYMQAGIYNPFAALTGAGTFPSSVPSSNYPYNNGYNYQNSNPMLDTYPYYERDRMRELREREMLAAQSAPYSSSFGNSASASSLSSHRDGHSNNLGSISSNNNFYSQGRFRDGRSNDQDSLAMSSGSHQDEHGEHHVYTSKVNTNAIGLLGLMGLLSLLGGVLNLFTTTTTTTAAARKKRSMEVEKVIETAQQKTDRLFTEILPHLTPIAHVVGGTLPKECIFQGVCMTNKILVDEMDINGRMAGQKITSGVVKLLINVVKPIKMIEHKHICSSGKNDTGDLRKILEAAGLHGRNQKDCVKTYPVCSALGKGNVPTLPFVIKMQNLPRLIAKFSKLAKYGWPTIPMNL